MRLKRKVKTFQSTADTAAPTAAVLTATSSVFPTETSAAHKSPPAQTTTPARSPSPQIIEDRYIDDDKLLELCSQRFPSGSYRLRYKFNRWYLDAPSWLDDRTLELCEIDLRV